MRTGWCAFWGWSDV